MPFKTIIKILLFQLAVLSTFGQDSIKEIRLSQIDWKLNFPTIANVRSSITQDTIKQISPTYIKESAVIEKDKYNTCTIKVKPSEPDSLKAMPDVEAWTRSNKIIVMIFTQQGSDIKFIDSASSIEILDGVQFNIFYYKMKLANYPTSNVYLFYGKHDMHDINIEISYDDFDIDLGKQFLDIVRRSKFGKGNNKFKVMLK